MRFVDSPELSAPLWGPDHPFKSERIAITRTLLEHCGLLDPEQVVDPVPMEEGLLARVHDAAYVDAARAAGSGQRLEHPWRFGLGTADNPIVAGMDRAAERVCDATVTAAELVARGDALRAASFAGGLHHAHRSSASGFCLFNDLALAVERLTVEHGLRVAYLDIDAHHGDGVQAAFEDRAEVLTLSLHESGRYLFPGTGFEGEVGRGEGLGACVNLPLEPGTDDAGFLEVFDLVVPAALAAFEPDLVLLQAGADAHHRDPLAHLELSLDGLDAVYQRVVALADRHCAGRLVVTGGGGYDAYRTVPRAWARLWCRMSGGVLPVELPASWRELWHGRLPEALPARSEDDPVAGERTEGGLGSASDGGRASEERTARWAKARARNRVVADRALATLTPLWAAWR